MKKMTIGTADTRSFIKPKVERKARGGGETEKVRKRRAETIGNSWRQHHKRTGGI